VIAISAVSVSSASAVLPGSSTRSPTLLYAPLTEKEVVSTCTWRAEMPKTCRARLAIPANSFVGSCAYNQSRVRPRQSSLSISALIPAPSKCSTGLFAKYCGTRYNCRLLNPKPFKIIATVAVPTLTCCRLAILNIQPHHKTNLLAHARHNPQVIEPFIEILVHCGHQESSVSVDSTLPIFRKTVNQSAECGIQEKFRRHSQILPGKMPSRKLCKEKRPAHHLWTSVMRAFWTKPLHGSPRLA